MPRIGALIFDLDGCLVDSERLSLGTLSSEMAAYGLDHDWKVLRDRYLGVSLARVRADIAEETGRPCGTEFDARFEARLLARYETELTPVPGAPEMLGRLRAAGVPMAIATGGSVPRMGRTLELSGLRTFFGDQAYSADEVPRGKPAPDIFRRAAEGLGHAPGECLVVEDSPHGIRGARAAGMQAAGFIGGAHLDGLRDAHAERLAEAGATHVLRRLDALLPLLREGGAHL